MLSKNKDNKMTDNEKYLSGLTLGDFRKATEGISDGVIITVSANILCVSPLHKEIKVTQLNGDEKGIPIIVLDPIVDLEIK